MGINKKDITESSHWNPVLSCGQKINKIRY